MTRLNTMATRLCDTCGKEFPKEQCAKAWTNKKTGHVTYRNRCKPCHSTITAKMHENYIHCPRCNRDRPPKRFMHDGIEFRHCEKCRAEQAEAFTLKRKDIEYDYAFARSVLGMTHRGALGWLCAHYDVLPNTLRKYEFPTAVWVPDPWEELPTKVCSGPCGKELHADEFTTYTGKSGKTLLEPYCRTCNAARNRKWREKNGQQKTIRSKVRL